MRSPKPPKEDPAVVEAREREQRRAETARTEETQAYLAGATLRRNRRFGRVGSGGSVPIYGGGRGGSNVTGRGTGGGLGGGGSGSGDAFSGGGRMNQFDRPDMAVLY